MSWLRFYWIGFVVSGLWITYLMGQRSVKYGIYMGCFLIVWTYITWDETWTGE